MNPKKERAIKRGAWALVVLLVAGSVVIAAWSLKRQGEQVELVITPPTVAEANGDGDEALQESLRRLEKKRMSRQIVKVVVPPPPPPPKPPAPPLEKLVKLSGVIDFGNGTPPEAIIETVQTRQTKTYKVGDALTPVPAKIEEISDGVIVRYDEKRWKLTYSGVEKLSEAQGKRNEP